MTYFESLEAERFTKREDKLAELIIYISDKCRGDTDFGKTMLNKILFFSDMLFYANTGKPITGVDYFALENGPGPRRMVPILEELHATGDIIVVPADRFGRMQYRVTPLRKAKLDLFTAEEIDFVGQIIKFFEGTSARAVSNFSHQFACVEAASIGENIPYEAIFVSNNPPTPRDLARGVELAEKYGW